MTINGVDAATEPLPSSERPLATAAKRSAHIFVSRLDPGLRCDELADHLEHMLHLRPTVELGRRTHMRAATCRASVKTQRSFRTPIYGLKARWCVGGESNKLT